MSTKALFPNSKFYNIKKTPHRWLEMSLVIESRVTVREMCSETLPVPERPSQSRDEEPPNPDFIIYNFWFTISSKKVMPFHRTTYNNSIQTAAQLRHRKVAWDELK